MKIIMKKISRTDSNLRLLFKAAKVVFTRKEQSKRKLQNIKLSLHKTLMITKRKNIQGVV